MESRAGSEIVTNAVLIYRLNCDLANQLATMFPTLDLRHSHDVNLDDRVCGWGCKVVKKAALNKSNQSRELFFDSIFQALAWDWP